MVESFATWQIWTLVKKHTSHNVSARWHGCLHITLSRRLLASTIFLFPLGNRLFVLLGAVVFFACYHWDDFLLAPWSALLRWISVVSYSSVECYMPSEDIGSHLPLCSFKSSSTLYCYETESSALIFFFLNACSGWSPYDHTQPVLILSFHCSSNRFLGNSPGDLKEVFPDFTSRKILAKVPINPFKDLITRCHHRLILKIAIELSVYDIFPLKCFSWRMRYYVV